MIASMANEFLVSADGLEKMREELKELKGPVRHKIADAIREAKAHGDLRENAAYHEARLNQRRLEARIADLEKAVLLAKVVEPKGPAGGAQLGSVVTIQDAEFGEEFEVRLVGSFEADPANDLISISSPLGEALLGKVLGDVVDVESPDGTNRYEIKRVE